MHHSIPFRLLVLVFISTVSPLPGLDIGSYSADNIPISALASEEQIFGPIVSTEYPEPSIGLDTLNDCVGPAADNLDLFSSDYTLQARQSICPNPSSADEEHREDSNSNTSSPPSAGIFDLDLFDNSIDPDPSPDPPRRIFSLPQDYQDQRCKEFGIIQYAVCSSGDYRDEEKSVAYAFHPVRTYRLKRCTFMFNQFSICFYPGKIWCCVVYSEIGGDPVADGCVEVSALPGRLDGSLYPSPFR